MYAIQYTMYAIHYIMSSDSYHYDDFFGSMIFGEVMRLLEGQMES